MSFKELRQVTDELLAQANQKVINIGVYGYDASAWTPMSNTMTGDTIDVNISGGSTLTSTGQGKLVTRVMENLYE